MAKIIYQNPDFQQQFLAGFNQVANTIAATAGPLGRNVLIEQSHDLVPLILNDGVMIAKAINLVDPVANLGASIIKHVAIETNTVGGDGTTTAVILTQSLINKVFALMNQNKNPIKLKQQFETITPLICQQLEQLAQPVYDQETVAAVATIAGNNPKIGKIIAQAFSIVGPEGIIQVQEALTNQSSLEVTEGFSFNGGYLSRYFINDLTRMRLNLQGVKLLICDFAVTNLQFFLLLLEELKKVQQPLLLVAKDFSDDVITALNLNKLKKIVHVIPIKPANYFNQTSDLLLDLAVWTQSQLLDEAATCPSLQELQVIDEISIDQKQTTITQNQEHNQSLTAHITTLQEQSEQSTTDAATKKALAKRLGQLNAKVALLKIAGETEIEQQEKKYRIEDALNATKHAIQEGIVPGSGASFIYAYQQAKHKHPQMLQATDAIEIFDAVMLAPCQQIMRNSGCESHEIKDFTTAIVNNQIANLVFDGLKNELVDPWTAGIIDPLKVVLTAFKKAVSVAITMMTTDAVVVNEKEKQKFVFRDLN